MWSVCRRWLHTGDSAERRDTQQALRQRCAGEVLRARRGRSNWDADGRPGRLSTTVQPQQSHHAGMCRRGTPRVLRHWMYHVLRIRQTSRLEAWQTATEDDHSRPYWTILFKCQQQKKKIKKKNRIVTIIKIAEKLLQQTSRIIAKFNKENCYCPDLSAYGFCYAPVTYLIEYTFTFILHPGNSRGPRTLYSQ